MQHLTHTGCTKNSFKMNESLFSAKKTKAMLIVFDWFCRCADKLKRGVSEKQEVTVSKCVHKNMR